MNCQCCCLLLKFKSNSLRIWFIITWSSFSSISVKFDHWKLFILLLYGDNECFLLPIQKKNFATNYITIIIIQQRMNEWMNWPATSNAVHTHTHTHINMYVQQNIVIQTRIRNWKTNETKKNPLDAHPNNISKKND